MIPRIQCQNLAEKLIKICDSFTACLAFVQQSTGSMLARAVALAIVGSATAFSPMMSMETSRRQVYDCDRKVLGARGRQVIRWHGATDRSMTRIRKLQSHVH